MSNYNWLIRDIDEYYVIFGSVGWKLIPSEHRLKTTKLVIRLKIKEARLVKTNLTD